MAANPLEWVERARTYVEEVQAEFRKVTWPSRRETIAGTVSVIVITLVVASLLSLVDLALAEVIQSFLP